MTVQEKAALMKELSPKLAATGGKTRNLALSIISEALRSHADEIFAANRRDIDNAHVNDLPASVIKRLVFDENKLKAVLDGITSLIALPDPLGRVLLHRELDTGLELYRVSCPIGVIGIIFEARPDALVQISTLCIKSGNCALLKGGKETANTNRVLFDIINHAAVRAGLPEGFLFQAEERSEIAELLKCEGLVDLIIPRGSNSFVKYIMDNTSIPVMGHADGVCHIYVDSAANPEMALKVITDAKTQYVSVCNAVETVLIDKAIADTFVPRFTEAMENAHVTVNFDPEDFHTEYLDYKVSVGIVDGIDAAIEHINRFGSHHTDSIITSDSKKAEHFMQLVDSANVYHNCSTRFADGFRYGFGAEVGISTSKLHARGPVGLEGLVTYKYKLYGEGHTVGDYVDGNKKFNFRDL